MHVRNLTREPLRRVRLILGGRRRWVFRSLPYGRTRYAIAHRLRPPKVGRGAARPYRIVIDSATQAIARVALRVKLGGHHVPEHDIRRRFDRSRRHFIEDYLPIADE